MDIRQQNYYPPQAAAAAPTSSSNNGFPIIAISIIGIFATILILVSYYIFVTSCCFRLKNLLNPAANSSLHLQQPFSFRGPRNSQDLFMAAYSPSLQLGQLGGRGLDESMIQEIPTFHYCKTDQEEDEEDEEDVSRSLFKCVVCLNEFQDNDMLRLLPNCNHAFHIDCIDIWLQDNGNCPLCRTSLCGIGIRNPNTNINVIAPNSSPQDLQQQPFIISRVGSDEHFVMTNSRDIEASTGSDSNRHLGQSSRRKSERQKIIGKMRETKKMKMRRRFSVMGDECIDVRERRDEQFSVKPMIRRSFSMDYSADDRHVYLSSSSSVLQEEMFRQHINGEISSSSRRSQRSIFSFGCGSRRSDYAVLPI